MTRSLAADGASSRGYETDAWVIYAGGPRDTSHAELVRERIEIDPLGPGEVLVEPLYGCWEGNMGHAIERSPVDICRMRREKRVVLGNAGVVRVVELGPEVKGVAPGDVAMLFASGEQDRVGYMKKALGFDAVGQSGMLAKRTKLREDQLIVLPPNNGFSLPQWAAFSVRYVTAWSNWELAYGVFRLQMTAEDCPRPYVWGWGGGTTLAELDLAQRFGCDAVMISGTDVNIDLIKSCGIEMIDRREYPNLLLDQERFDADATYRESHNRSKREFVQRVTERTNGELVHIFLDYLGPPVYQLTLRLLARQGVIATAGWKEGRDVSHSRSQECIMRHQHIYTHYARRSQAEAAISYAIKTGWMPQVDERVYSFDEIPELGQRYLQGDTHYFSCYSINPT
ncbi:hypothetical protein WME94_52550 [Sorangium sp. So ce429]